MLVIPAVQQEETVLFQQTLMHKVNAVTQPIMMTIVAHGLIHL